jgi:hypothetical protein
MTPITPSGPPGSYPQARPHVAPSQGLPPQAGYPYAGPPAAPGLPPAGANRYGQAQASLKSAGATLRVTQLACAGFGALLAVAGLVMVFTVGVEAGSGTLIAGVALGWAGWFTLPKFMGQLGGATAVVDALHAKEQLAMTGTPMTARVLAVQQTGTMINMNPQVHAALEVQGPQGPFQVQTMAVIPQMNIPQFQPGAMIHVRVNPMNPQDVAVVF